MQIKVAAATAFLLFCQVWSFQNGQWGGHTYKRPEERMSQEGDAKVQRLCSPLDLDDTEVFHRNVEVRGQSANFEAPSQRTILGRREWMKQGIAVVAAAATISASPQKALADNIPPSLKPMPIKMANFTSQFEPIIQTKKKTGQQQIPTLKKANTTKTEFKPINITKVASENTINITMYATDSPLLPKSAIYVDRKDYTRVTVRKLPKWIPKSWRPRESVEIPNSQLLLAATLAGSVTESIRTTALYPLQVVKSRIQADPKHQRARTYKRKIQALYLSFLRNWREGDLFAGLLPSLLVTVPASGVYCGVRDVTNRFLHMATPLADIEIVLLGAFIADVISLAFRTPADVYAVRLQVAQMMPNGTNVDLADSVRDGIDRLPPVIVTDLPYLLIRLLGNWIVTRGDENLAAYEVETIAVACICAALTTPFDVARTRILINDDSGDTERQRERSRRRNGVLRTMRNITKESEGGVQNLYAGWIERTAYFGIGRAWFDPIRVIGYLGIRDAILLRWFI